MSLCRIFHKINQIDKFALKIFKILVNILIFRNIHIKTYIHIYFYYIYYKIFRDKHEIWFAKMFF